MRQQLDTYISFGGNCTEAMRFYESTLGAKLDALMKYGEAPDPSQCPAAGADKITHAHLVLEGGSDLELLPSYVPIVASTARSEVPS